MKLVKGSTLYVTTAEGNTVKVSVPKAATITKSVTAKVSAIKPGDTVTAVRGVEQRRRQGHLRARGRHRPAGLPRPGRRAGTSVAAGWERRSADDALRGVPAM